VRERVRTDEQGQDPDSQDPGSHDPRSNDPTGTDPSGTDTGQLAAPGPDLVDDDGDGTRAGGSAAVLRSSTVMAAGTAVSRVLGFGRSLVLVSALGLTYASANTFDTANKIPNILYMLLAGGVLNAVLVPQIVRASRGPDGGQEFVNRLVTLAVAGLVVVTAGLTAAAPLLVRAYAVNQTTQWLALGTAMALWCIPQVLFYGLYTVLGQVLNARGRFGAYMWAPVVNNVVGIAGLVLFLVLYGRGDAGQHALDTWTPMKVAVLGGTTTLGVVAQALVLIGPLRAAGFRYRPVWGVRGVGLGSARRVAVWTFAAVLVGQIGLLVTTNVANRAEALNQGTALQEATPAAAAYSYAYLLFMLPHSLVAVSLVTALFTRMSHAAHADDWPTVRGDLSLGLRTVGVFSVVATVGLVVLADPVGVAMTGSTTGGLALGSVVAAMALGLAPFSATYLFHRVYYAYEDARTPFWIQVPTVGVIIAADVAAALLLPPEQMVVGAALGMSASAFLSAGLSAWWLRRSHGTLDGPQVVRTHVRLVVAALVAGGAGWLVTHLMRDQTLSGRGGAVLVCAAAGAAVLVVYLVGLRLLRVEELRSLTRRLGRVGRLVGG
jgi:putative peptidoglycan lipid II flippase